MILLRISIFALLANEITSRVCRLPEISNGRVSVLGQRYDDNYAAANSFAVITCVEGYAITDGVSVSQCEDTGGWTANLGRCALPQQKNIDCLRNLNIQNGYLSFTKDPRTFKVNCKDGFNLIGATTVYCFDDRSWTIPGRCQSTQKPNHRSAPSSHWLQQCWIPDTLTGMISINDGAPFLPYSFSVPPGTKVKLTCTPGFIAEGSAESTCVGGVIWSPQPLNCIKVPSRETTTNPTTTREWTTAPRIISGLLSQVRCELPPSQTGTFSVNGAKVKGVVRPGMTVELECNQLYEVRDGEANSYCQIDGTWSRPIGTCYPKQLQATFSTTKRCFVTRPKNGIVLINDATTADNDLYQVFPGNVVSLQCYPGFEVRDGASETRCSESGYLDPSLGRCASLLAAEAGNEPKNWNNPTTPSMITSRFGSSFSDMNGEPVWCAVAQPQHGSVVLQRPRQGRSLTSTLPMHQIVAGTQITLRCSSGYSISNGAETVTCLKSGFLSESLGECVPSNKKEEPSNDLVSSIFNSLPFDFGLGTMPNFLNSGSMPNIQQGMMLMEPRKTRPQAKIDLSEKGTLIEAAKMNDVETIEHLLSTAIDRDERDKDGRTALMWAASLGNFDILKMLIERGATLNLIDSSGYSALLHAAQNGKVKEASHLAQAGSDVNLKSKKGDSAILLAVKGSNVEIVQMLLQHKANVDEDDANGQTALMWAARNDHKPLVDLLLKASADVDARDFDGTTALMQASKLGHNAIVQRLLDAGAQVNLRDGSGMTALDYAEAFGRLQTVSLLHNRAVLLQDMARHGVGFDYGGASNGFSFNQIRRGR